MAPPMTLAAGSQLGPYEIVSQLGQGGMGVVYQAHDPRLDRYVAVKLLPPDLTRDETAKQRFLQEAKAASRWIAPTSARSTRSTRQTTASCIWSWPATNRSHASPPRLTAWWPSVPWKIAAQEPIISSGIDQSHARHQS